MKKIRIFLIVAAAIILTGGLLFVKTFFPRKTKAANFTTAFATLTNSRLSYRAQVSSGTSGSTLVTIKTGSADPNTNHLFPGDTICFTDTEANGLNGCIGNKTYTVGSILTGGVTFNLTTALTNSLITDGFVMASQSGTLTLTFTTVSEIPINGDLYITIPTVDTANRTNDGFPDTGTLVANGFDQGKVVSADVTAPTTNCTQWNATPTVTSGDATHDLRISIQKITATCPGGNALTVTIGGTHKLINPAAITSQTQGTANIYQINVSSRDTVGGNVLDSSDVSVSPVEAVLVSATVDETLSLTVAGISADSGSYCGLTRTASTPDTTATSVPWGIVSPTYAAATNNTNQQVTVSTNANAGYKVYIEENDQMGKDGNVCTGTSPSAGDFTFGTGKCIRDTLCGATPCTESSAQDWTNMATYVGLGFSLENVPSTGGTDAAFLFGANFSTRQIADMAIDAPETRQYIMSNSGPVSGSSVYVCYRIAIGATQPAGYYYNKVKYTAVATF